MPAKWQRWMPMEVDALKASPAVQAMHPCARAGYVWLLLDAWQTEDCTIPSDPIDLADKSGLGDELWATHGLRILRKFEQVEGSDRLRNLPQYERWTAAKAIYEKRLDAANRTNNLRSPLEKHTVTETLASRSSTDCGSPSPTPPPSSTKTVTETKTKKQEQIHSPKPRKRSSETKHSSDPRHVASKAEIFLYYRAYNAGEDPDWEGREGRALAMLLSRNPKLTADGIRKLLAQRALSEVNHSERPALWLSIITSYRNGPLDKYGKPLSLNGNGGRSADLSKQGMGTLVGVSAESIRRGERQSSLDAHGCVPTGETEPSGLEFSFGDVYESPEEPRPKSLSSGDGNTGGKPTAGGGDGAPFTW